MKKFKSVTILRPNPFFQSAHRACNGSCRCVSCNRESTDALQDTLLLREIAETNNWARLAFQLYFVWFALHFTVNGVAIGLLFTTGNRLPSYANLIYLVFIGWNVLGIIGTALVYKGLVDHDRRIKEALKAMGKRHHLTDEESRGWLFSVPRLAISIALSGCAFTMFLSIAFWFTIYIT